MEPAELRFEQCDYAGRLTDQSAGGFGLQFDTPLAIQAGQTAVLSWKGGCCRVRVSARVDEENFVRLGLVRLEELETAGELDPPTGLWALCRRRRLPLPQGSWTYYIAGLVIILGCGIAALVWEQVPAQLAKQVQPTTKRLALAADSGALKIVKRSSKKAAPGFAAVSFANDREHRTIESKVLPKPLRQWIATRNQVMRDAAVSVLKALPDVPTIVTKQAVFDAISATTRAAEQVIGISNDSVLPAISQYMDILQVDAEQRLQLDALMKSTREATQSVHRRSRELGTAVTMSEIDRIRRSAGMEATAILSDEQVGQLRRLMSGKRPVVAGAPKSAAPLATNDAAPNP